MVFTLVLRIRSGLARRPPRRRFPRRGDGPAWRAALAVGAVGFLATVPAALAHGPVSHEIADLTQKIAAEPGNAAEYLRRGELYRIRREWKLALADYERAARLDPSLAAVDVCRAALDLDRGQPARARVALDRLLARVPENADALLLRAEAWIKLGKPREATRDYDRLLEVTRRPVPDYYLARARAVEACGPEFVDEALRGIDRGIERLGPIVSLEFHAIELECRRQRFDAALARLDRVAPQFGRRETVLEKRAKILDAAGRADEARQAYAAALAAIESIPPGRRTTRTVTEMEARIKANLAARAPVQGSGGTPTQPR